MNNDDCPMTLRSARPRPARAFADACMGTALFLAFVLIALLSGCSAPLAEPDPTPATPAALTCRRIDNAPHGCANHGCWETLLCNRDPGADMGITCVDTGDGYYECTW